jgi:hypothetical protein
MDLPQRTKTGILIPARAESEDGTIGDGVIEIMPGHPDYDEWLAFLEGKEGLEGRICQESEDNESDQVFIG